MGSKNNFQFLIGTIKSDLPFIDFRILNGLSIPHRYD